MLHIYAQINITYLSAHQTYQIYVCNTPYSRPLNYPSPYPKSTYEYHVSANKKKPSLKNKTAKKYCAEYETSPF